MYTLLIVDDEPNILEGIKRLLDWKSLGVGRIETARSSLEVMSNILDWRPDICLMDVCIGNDKGYEVINCLNNLGVRSNYVMMSGYDEFSYACEAIRCGALDYLLKPVEKRSFLRWSGKSLWKSFMEPYRRRMKRRTVIPCWIWIMMPCPL